jgi:peptidoglycan/xylan/chitin deacetylase (PgdA/CDA1 family)
MGHPQMIGRPSRLRMLERVIRQIRAKGDVWFATPLEVARFWQARAA